MILLIAHEFFIDMLMLFLQNKIQLFKKEGLFFVRHCLDWTNVAFLLLKNYSKKDLNLNQMQKHYGIKKQ